MFNLDRSSSTNPSQKLNICEIYDKNDYSCAFKNRPFDLNQFSHISPDLDINKISSHVFSTSHINRGIMNLGDSTDEILNNIFYEVNMRYMSWEEGPNEIRTLINGFETTIRFYVKNGELLNLDSFIGYNQRIIGNLIK